MSDYAQVTYIDELQTEAGTDLVWTATGDPTLTLGDQSGFQFEVLLDRDGRKAWARIFQMQRYKATEWIFPRKKKRGTARRLRREDRP